MLQSLNTKASGIFARTFLGLLVASLALWGIGDIFRSSPSNTVVKVGNSVVSAQEMKNALDEEVANYRSMLGKQYSPELIASIGVPTQVLERLVQQKLVEAEVRDLGLMVPESHLMAELRGNPAFHGENGKFNTERFRQVLSTNGLSESMYVSLLSKEIAANMLLQSIMSGVQVPDAAAELAYLYENEKRVVDLLVFTPGLIKDVPDPENVELEQFYEENAENFRAEELRVISLLALDAEALKKGMEISEEDLLIEYQNRIDEFREPEKREIKQMLFEDETRAKKAHAALLAGTVFETVAAEFDANNENLLLGTMGKAEVLPEAEQAIFSLPTEGFTAPIQSSFGWHIFKVTRIQSAHTKPFADIRQQIESELHTQRASDEIYQLSNTLQDDLAGGATLEEAARSVSAQLKVYGPMDREGKSPDGTKVKIPQNYNQLLDTAFTLTEGGVSNLMESEDGSYYALRVDSIIPERTRALDEIRGTVIEKWKERQREKLLYQLAGGIAESLEKADIEAVAAKTGAQLLRGETITRSSTAFSNKERLPAMMISAVFSAQKGAVTEAYSIPNGGYLVARLTDIKTADTASEVGKTGLKTARDNLRSLYADELYIQYMAYLRQKHGVSEPDPAFINSLLQ